MNAADYQKNEKKARIILVGFGALPLRLMKNLLNAPGDAIVAGLLPASNLQRYGFLREHPLEIELLELARQNQIPILNSPSINSHHFLSCAAELSPNIILVCCWSEIIHANALSLENVTFINCHGSLLPKYRGACPHIATIFNGDIQTGITFHLIDEGIDTGDILFQETVDVVPGETALQLEARIADEFGSAVVPFLRNWNSGKIVASKQSGDVSYITTKRPEWGWIPWFQRPEAIDRRIRALDGILPLATSLGGIVVGFNSGQVCTATELRPSGQDLKLYSMRSQLYPGTILAMDTHSVIASTVDSEFVVKLELPSIVLPDQPQPTLRCGAQFQSIECNSILKSA